MHAAAAEYIDALHGCAQAWLDSTCSIGRVRQCACVLGENCAGGIVLGKFCLGSKVTPMPLFVCKP